MKQALLILLGTAFLSSAIAQEKDTIPVPKKEQGDTIRVGDIIILKKGGEVDKDKNEEDVDIYAEGSISIIPTHKTKKRNNITTNWLIFDYGILNIDDQTNYSSQEAIDFMPGANPSINSSDFYVKSPKSFNINIWLFMQRLNVYKHVVNLKYGFGIEMHNFYYKSRVRYQDDVTGTYTFRDTVSLSKNKLAADYFTVPFMININTNPRQRNGGLNLSFGISAGYLYNGRQKIESGERGKQKYGGGFNLEPWKIAAIGELGLGPIKFYGSYALTELHKYGVDQHPYAVGIRFSRL
jgi:hypothetical protein